MKRGLVLVEGQTEERFVNDCLAPYLYARGLLLERPTIVTTKRLVGGGSFKGGVTAYQQVQRDLKRPLNDSNASVVTTLFDYYALPSDFPGMKSRPGGDARARVAHVEAAWSSATGDRRFVPHLVLHEFEAWVYAAPSCLEPWMFDDTSPSKRLRDVFAAYQKPFHGPLVVEAIGLEMIRTRCPHVHAWLSQLEAIGQSS